MVIDEDHLDPLANGEVRRLAERGRQLLQEVVKELGQRVAPAPA
jgi:hypothetical protein